MQDSSQVERQIYILLLISENHTGFTIDEIKSRLERNGIDVNRKTVERDIDYLTVNFPIYEEERNSKTYYISRGIGIDKLTFDFSELLALHFIREILKAYDGIDVGRTAIGLIEKIVSSAPDFNKAHIEKLNDMMRVSLPDVIHEKDLNEEFLNTIQDAIAERKKLVIDYHSFNKDEITCREIDPYLLDINEGCYHLIGFCHLRNGLRDFRVSRIKDIKIKNETFIKPKNFYEDYKQMKFDKLTGNKNIELVLKFKGYSARFVKEYEYDRADEIVSIDDGCIIFKKETTMTQEIEKWVLGFGSEVEVIKPLELRDKIVQDIKNMSEIYKNV